ncbi:MAG: twin-arginine translocation signal domain-containing protein [Deltaproteobacteria bacterium]|nr:twin-arginine translocation signal domain-containing protein [Deltaproteobacteria bacterium]
MKQKNRITRRKFLQAAGVTAASAALAPWNSPARAAVGDALQATGLSLPCCIGEVNASGALVWLRAESESEVAVEYGKDASFTGAVRSASIRVVADNDYTGVVQLSGLEPGTTYYCRAAVANKKVGPSSRFVSAPRADQLADVRFAFSGDTRQNFQPFAIMDAIRAKQPDFFLHLGDTIYADRDGAARDLAQFRQKYVNNRKDEATQRLFGETGLYVTWDNHEVAEAERTANVLAPLGRRAFFDYWPIAPELAQAQRVYRSARWGGLAELFILDTRQYRDDKAGTILGATQMRWLLDGIGNSTARFKFVCTSVPFSGPSADKWGGYPKDREALLSAIKEGPIGGVIFLAADAHYAAVVRVAGDATLREVIVGPMAAAMGKATGDVSRFEYYNNRFLNYALASVRADGDNAYAEIEILTDKNILLHKLRIDAGEK